MAAAQDRRVDPVDGRAYTFAEISGFYGRSYGGQAIKAYWEEECLPVAPSARSTAAPQLWGKALVAVMARRERDWRVGPVVYQAFVDRFAPPADLEGKRALYPAPCTLHEWSELPERGELNAETGYYMHELAFWGGDLLSLLSKLDHVKGLGADVLYLQPIAQAFSNHKYDTTDYLALDPQYGTLEDFQHFSDAVHEAGMRFVVDGVFNHAGTRWGAFKEAMAEKGSPKRDWFFFGDEYSDGYKVWGCAQGLAELHLENLSLQKHLWKGKDSVVATWFARGADGWRLDVASEIGFELLASLTRSAHQHKRGSLVVGEVWAYPPRWSSAMDGVLSLHLGELIFGLVEGTCPGPSAARSIERLIEDSSMEEALRSWIVLSNHDMRRLASRLPDLKLRKLALILQFTWPGAPLVYYGDELGLEGQDDPLNRGPMPWELATEENEWLAYVRRLVAVRRRLRALRIGNYRTLASQRLMAFVRLTERAADTVVVLANPTEAPVTEMVVLPVPSILGNSLFRDELASEVEVRALGSTVTLEVGPKSARVLSMADESGKPSGDQYKRLYGHPASFPSVKP